MLYTCVVAVSSKTTGLELVQAWYVGVSRYIDNKHSIEDIIAGFFLGLVAAVWAVAECFIAHRGIASRHGEDAEAVVRSGSNQGLHAHALGPTASPDP